MAPIFVRTAAAAGVLMPETSAGMGDVAARLRSMRETEPAAAGRHSLAGGADKEHGQTTTLPGC